MGLNNFEKIIKDHQEYFESDPSMEHMDKFLFKLKEKEKTTTKTIFSWQQSSFWLGIAASISILISMAWFIQQQAPQEFESDQMGLSMELYEIKTYYNSESTKKLKEIKNCTTPTQNTKKLIETTEAELMKLDYNSEKIENKLKNAAGNKKLELAFIQNLKAKNDLLETMQNQICSNKNILTQ